MAGEGKLSNVHISTEALLIKTLKGEAEAKKLSIWTTPKADQYDFLNIRITCEY